MADTAPSTEPSMEYKGKSLAELAPEVLTMICKEYFKSTGILLRWVSDINHSIDAFNADLTVDQSVYALERTCHIIRPIAREARKLFATTLDTTQIYKIDAYRLSKFVKGCPNFLKQNITSIDVEDFQIDAREKDIHHENYVQYDSDISLHTFIDYLPILQVFNVLYPTSEQLELHIMTQEGNDQIVDCSIRAWRNELKFDNGRKFLIKLASLCDISDRMKKVQERGKSVFEVFMISTFQEMLRVRGDIDYETACSRYESRDIGVKVRSLLRLVFSGM